MSPVRERIWDGSAWRGNSGAQVNVVTPPVVQLPPAEIAGADALGSTNYTIPSSNVLYVSTSGSDANDGSAASPKATIGAAVSAASSGDTIIIRAGEYRQSIGGNVTKALTIQNYPGETVWFDGSDVVTGFTPSGGRWVKSGWTVEFDHSASYTYGSNAGNFVNATNPLASWPDQVWIDGVRQNIVASNPAAGQFCVDYAADTLTLGSDPSSKQVRATVRGTFAVLAAVVTLRGIGVRRYGTALPALGMVNIVSAGSGSRVENCHFEDCATQLLSIGSNNSTRTMVTRNTFKGGGMTAVHSNNSVGCVFDFTNNIIDDTNWRGWNVQPASAALRTSRSLNAVVANNIVTNTGGGGIWFDVYSRNITIVNNIVDSVADMGICYEISENAIIVGNRVRNSAKQAILVLASADVQVWNNEVERSTQFDIAFKDDERGPASEFSVEVYIRRGLMKNNVIQNTNSQPTTGWRSVVYDSALVLPADGMMVADGIAGNVWTSDQAPSSATSTTRMIGWGIGGGSSTVTAYTTPNAFATAKSAYTGANLLVASLSPSAADLSAAASVVGEVIPTNIATALGLPTLAGNKIIGPPLTAPTANPGAFL